MTYKKAKSRT